MIASQRRKVYLDKDGNTQKIDVLKSYRKPGTVSSDITQHVGSSALGKIITYSFIFLLLFIAIFIYKNLASPASNQDVFISYVERLKAEKELSLSDFSKDLDKDQLDIFEKRLMEKMICRYDGNTITCSL